MAFVSYSLNRLEHFCFYIIAPIQDKQMKLYVNNYFEKLTNKSVLGIVVSNYFNRYLLNGNNLFSNYKLILNFFKY